MARYVTISTIGATPPTAGTDLSFPQAVERMIEFWTEQLEQVLPDRPDLIVLPEACDRFADYDTQQMQTYYRARGDKLLEFFADVASKHRCYIAYAAMRWADDNALRNSIQIIGRDGQVKGIYDKNHPTIGEMEDEAVRPGQAAPIIECDFGKVACAICFDLNFNELRLQYVAAKPDLIVFCSMYHGGQEQSNWAYSCRAHFVGAVTGLPSSIISPIGQNLATSTNYFNFVTAQVNLDCQVAHLDYNRDRLEALRAKYGPKVKVVDPGLLASVLISSQSEDATVKQMFEEFEIELLDDYLDRARAFRANQNRQT